MSRTRARVGTAIVWIKADKQVPMRNKKERFAGRPSAQIALAIGTGVLAGIAGTAAITLSQMIEMKITGRKPSNVPAAAAEKVLDIRAATENDRSSLSQEVHWAYGTLWGLPRGVLSGLGIRSWPASLLHFAAIFTGALTIPAALEVSSPPKEWSAKELATDALHHAVYACAAGWVADRIVSRRRR